MNIKNLIICLQLSNLLITFQFTKAVTVSQTDAEDDSNLDDDIDLDLDDILDADSIPEYKKMMAQIRSDHLSDSSRMFTYDQVMELAYEPLIFVKPESVMLLRHKHEIHRLKLNEEDGAIVSGAMACAEYVKTFFIGQDRTELSNNEVIDQLSLVKYEKWMENMPEEVIDMIDEYVMHGEIDL